jgi:acyl-CoA thioester hydrolase
MPLTHTRKFRIRHYECDAFGHLNHANYVRYMQETAFDASAAAGYDSDAYNALGRYWLIRETDIEYLKPTRYGDTLEVKTWVIDFHRVRSRRAYEIRFQGSDEIVANASTDWVFLENDTNRPAKIPVEIKEAFFPEGPPDSFPAREKFPQPPTPPTGKFSMSLPVAWHDLDAAQHVNNANYLKYTEECGMQVIAAHGWPISRMISEGFAIFVRRHQIQYLQPAVLGDDLLISTWVSNVRRSTATRHYLIQRKSDQSNLALIHTNSVWVDLKTGRPIRIPETLLSDFAANIVYQDD